MRQPSRSTTAGVALLAIAALPPDAPAQRFERASGEVYPDAHVTLELMGGYADYGRFLEQLVLVNTFERQREVTAGGAFALAASAGVYPWEKTGIRLGVTWAPTEFEFRDDSGIGSDLLDEDDLADLNVFVVSLDVLRFLLDPSRRLTPYASAGITAAWWNADGEEGIDEILTDDDETHFRWGGIGTVGAQYRASSRIGVRLEVATMALGNPFDGKDAFRTATGVTFDEPSTTRLTRIALGVTYSFLRD